MIILYIPFAIREKEDLVEKAVAWQYTLKIQDPNKEVLVLQYGFDEDSIPEDEYLTVYVLCHGTDNEIAMSLDAPHSPTYYLASRNTAEIGTVFLPAEVVAARYERDFCYYKTNIAKIKLYFCNNVGTEKEIALHFYNALVNLDENTRIDYYFGILSTPVYDPQKKKFKKLSTVNYDDHKETKYVSDTRFSLFQKRKDSSYNSSSHSYNLSFNTKEEGDASRNKLFKNREILTSREDRIKYTQEKSKEERHNANNIRRGIKM